MGHIGAKCANISSEGQLYAVLGHVQTFDGDIDIIWIFWRNSNSFAYFSNKSQLTRHSKFIFITESASWSVTKTDNLLNVLHSVYQLIFKVTWLIKGIFT